MIAGQRAEAKPALLLNSGHFLDMEHHFIPVTFQVAAVFVLGITECCLAAT